MVFITKPTEEGETKECPNCDVSLIGRWTDYKGKFEDKLQWQTIEPRKAHYDKNGNCKGQQESGPKEQQTLQSEKDLSQGESNPEIISLATLDEKIKTIEGITQSILHIVADMKTEGVKICQE